MRKRLKKPSIWFLFLLATICPPAGSAQPGQVLEVASHSLVKIETGSTAASGFIWPDSSHVVTALHVVDGQNQITAHFVNANGQIQASSTAVVTRVLKSSDLVMLKLQNPQDRPPLPINVTPPQVKQILDALGFPMNIAGFSNTEVKIRFGGSQLRSILPPKVLNNFGAYPSTTIEILNLESNLVPGLSGAPIVDNRGRVVGIADGGLESGAVGISWGIPASHLQQLANSNVTSTPNQPGVRELFSADLQANVGNVLHIGALRMSKVRSRTFAQLAATADDQLGLNQLATSFAIFDPYSFRYDIYQEMESGATIAVPEGAQLSQEGNFTVVRMGDPRMIMKFQVHRVQDIWDAQNKSLEFEGQLAELDGWSQVTGDPAWSYFQPFTTLGVTVNRKGFFRNIFDGYYWISDKYYFETLASNGNTLLAVAAVNNDNSPTTYQMELYCGNMPNDPNCAPLFQSRRIWSQMVLAVQFASIPY